MAIVKKVRKLGGRPTFGAAGREASSLRPEFVEQAAPCRLRCPNGTQVREMLTTLARGAARGLTTDGAAERAFLILAARNPIPATCGWLCAHHCEDDCSRAGHDEALAVNQVERAVGEHAINRGWALPVLPGEPRAERVAVVGSGAAGLSVAYQLARRGYQVTVFEPASEAESVPSEAGPPGSAVGPALRAGLDASAAPRVGGELLAAVTEGLLPEEVLHAEIARIAALGVEFARQPWVSADGFARVVETKAGSAGGRFVPAALAAAVNFGRIAAERVDAELRSGTWTAPPPVPAASRARIRFDHYPHASRPPAAGRALTIDEAIVEAGRCLACGGCLECDNCWKYCPDQAVVKPLEPGQPYRFRLDFCQGCSKCAEQCPTGYIEMR